LNGAGIALGTIAVAGFAFALAGAIAMFFSSYLSRRSELRSLRIDLDREKMEIQTEPDEEQGEMRDLLKKDGYADAEVDVIMRRLVKNQDLFLKEMLRRELKVNMEDVGANPFRWPFFAGMAFLIVALLTVSPYALGVPRSDALVASLAFSLASLFALGSRAFVPGNFNLKAGAESAAVGAVAGVLLYLVGLAVSVA